MYQRFLTASENSHYLIIKLQSIHCSSYFQPKRAHRGRLDLVLVVEIMILCTLSMCLSQNKLCFIYVSIELTYMCDLWANTRHIFPNSCVFHVYNMFPTVSSLYKFAQHIQSHTNFTVHTCTHAHTYTLLSVLCSTVFALCHVKQHCPFHFVQVITVPILYKRL